ncbi:MAG: DUF1883 domain-containing protein [Candidatus Neomarinimicrobiota bacterium]
MHFIHYALDLGSRDVVQVDLDTEAYLRLMDDENYEVYRQGENYRYFGGLAEKSPANIKPPKKGHWHLCIDLGGKDGEFIAQVHIVQEVEPEKKRSSKRSSKSRR